jgi:queuine tRNA-ribosyltransferase
VKSAAEVFRLEKTDGDARAGVVFTEHGEVQTPVFMPVGTQASVKGVSPDELLEMQAQIILGNTYHLVVRPGLEVMSQMGGLHKFMRWQGPILTDSGGFQVFSLAKIREVREEGVWFSSHVDGKKLFLGPKEAIRAQVTLGSDIMMAFDECPPWPCSRDVLEKSLERTLRWAKICREEQLATKTKNLLFGIVQGGDQPDLRKKSCLALREIGFDGYAIGGVSVGEPEKEMMAAIDSSAPHLPVDRPRYVMGLGHPDQMVRMIGKGVDMFDCVLPTRVARNGTACTTTGPVSVRKSTWTRDEGPIVEGCGCYTCLRFSRAYIQHLIKAEELLGLRLISLHNLFFNLETLRQARRAILEGRWQSWSREFLERYQRGGTSKEEESTDDV